MHVHKLFHCKHQVPINNNPLLPSYFMRQKKENMNHKYMYPNSKQNNTETINVIVQQN